MSKDKKIIVLFGLGVAGFLFSGYLSAVKFFSTVCAFNESCPYFWGYPACYFGFVMFLAITIFASLLLFSKINRSIGLAVLSAVSFLGVLFAGNFTLKELPILFEKGVGAYMLGLPTCALGLTFFILIFIVTVYSLYKKDI